ncbi:MAG: exodeoxyribonuclease VII small subunit [Deltaproteobacteria bacterium]|nr:exodeoxyribonuclease VII small subunit [Deltaproteobacteria bacterium]
MDSESRAPNEKVAADEVPFEKLLADLEAVVSRLERGDVALEVALAEFERGTALVSRGQAILDRAEERVNRLLATRSGGLREAPFELDADGEGGGGSGSSPEGAGR